jgi:hypothetical protein
MLLMPGRVNGLKWPRVRTRERPDPAVVHEKGPVTGGIPCPEQVPVRDPRQGLGQVLTQVQ